MLVNSTEMVQTKNFFYDMHFCETKKEEMKINLDYTLKMNKTDEIINFGSCPYCNKVYFHKNFSSKNR